MDINLFLIPFIIILGLILEKNDNKRNRLYYIILSSVVLIFIAALRSPEWMTQKYSIDTLNYKGYFEDTFDMDWDEFWQSFYMRYFMGFGDNDVGFIALNRMVSLFTHEFWVFSMVANLLFFVPFGIILYRYTEYIQQVMFAYIFYIALVQVFLWAGARQIFSLGFDLMALLSIIDRNRIRTVIFFLIGVTIHFSSLLFMVPLFMIWYGVNPRTLKILHATCIVLFPVVLMSPNEMIVFMGNSMGIEKYADYGKGAVQGGATTFVFLIEALSLFCLLTIKRKDLIANPNIQSFYVMAPLFTLLAPLIMSNGTMIRISLYYHIFLILLVPYAIDCAVRKKNSSIFYAGVIGALSALSLAGGGMTYFFFWQF